MAKKSEELIGPIQTVVNSAIEVVAAQDDYVVIIDLAVTPGIVYKTQSMTLPSKY